MIVHLQQIDPEGSSLSGIESEDILGIDEPGIKSSWPVAYDIHVGLSDGGIFATGHLAVDLECECVRCLSPFRLHLEVPDFAMQEELGGAEAFDLSPYFREEIFLALPSHPHCDADGSHVCKPPATHDSDGSINSGDDARWSALDQLDLNRE